MATDYNQWLKERTETEERLKKQDEQAKSKGVLVGRIVREPYADSYAVYEILSETQNSVRIRVCKGLGDDWEIPYWGKEATIKKSYVLKKLAYEDNLKKIGFRDDSEQEA